MEQQMANKDKNKEEKEVEEVSPPEEESEDSSGLAGLLSSMERPEIRSMALYGEIEEEKAADICVGLLMLSQKKEEDDLSPIDFYISTYGGNADDMFAIYDMMNMAKRYCEVHTIGIGKVMSAGVLLLANGSPGHRSVGKHCRIMIHSCNAGSVGDIHNLKNEMEQIQHQQEQYINALVEVSSLTKRQLNRLLDRKVNVYLTAQEAIEYGIADKII
jgi:ATP-dependent Clp protease protease subunit